MACAGDHSASQDETRNRTSAIPKVMGWFGRDAVRTALGAAMSEVPDNRRGSRGRRKGFQKISVADR